MDIIWGLSGLDSHEFFFCSCLHCKWGWWWVGQGVGGGNNYSEFFSGLISCCSLTSAFTLCTFLFIFPFFFFFWTCNYRDFLTLSLSIVRFLSWSTSAKCKAVFISAEQRREEMCFKPFQKVIVSPTFPSFSLTFFLLLWDWTFHAFLFLFSDRGKLGRRGLWRRPNTSRYAEHKLDCCLQFISFVLSALCQTNNKNLFSNPLFIVSKVTKIFM